MTAKIHHLGFTALNHPPHNPDLAPSDFHLFPKLKEHVRITLLVRRTQDSDEDVVLSIRCDSLMKLPVCWQKCVDCRGVYGEK
jgi:hypothetical protein